MRQDYLTCTQTLEGKWQSSNQLPVELEPLKSNITWKAEAVWWHLGYLMVLNGLFIDIWLTKPAFESWISYIYTKFVDSSVVIIKGSRTVNKFILFTCRFRPAVALIFVYWRLIQQVRTLLLLLAQWDTSDIIRQDYWHIAAFKSKEFGRLSCFYMSVERRSFSIGTRTCSGCNLTAVIEQINTLIVTSSKWSLLMCIRLFTFKTSYNPPPP